MKPVCSCGARLRWVKTQQGKWMPIEPADDTPGNLVLEQTLFGGTTVRVVTPGAGSHVSHFATCPHADQYRRAPRPSKRATP